MMELRKRFKAEDRRGRLDDDLDLRLDITPPHHSSQMGGTTQQQEDPAMPEVDFPGCSTCNERIRENTKNYA